MSTIAELREALSWYQNPHAGMDATRASERKVMDAAEALIEIAEAAEAVVNSNYYTECPIGAISRLEDALNSLESTP